MHYRMFFYFIFLSNLGNIDNFMVPILESNLQKIKVS